MLCRSIYRPITRRIGCWYNPRQIYTRTPLVHAFKGLLKSSHYFYSTEKDGGASIRVDGNISCDSDLNLRDLTVQGYGRFRQNVIVAQGMVLQGVVRVKGDVKCGGGVNVTNDLHVLGDFSSERK